MPKPRKSHSQQTGKTQESKAAYQKYGDERRHEIQVTAQAQRGNHRVRQHQRSTRVGGHPPPGLVGFDAGTEIGRNGTHLAATTQLMQSKQALRLK